MTEKSNEKLICESCGEEFSCGSNAGKCWCFEFDVDIEASERRRENFTNCLCPKCLLKSAAEIGQLEKSLM